MRFAVLVPTVLCVIAACGGVGAALSEPVPDAALDQTPWERDWSADEPMTWRDGFAMDIAAGGDPRAADFVPVTGALVEVFSVAPDGTLSESPVGATATTGPDGRFHVGPAPEDGWVIRLSKPGATTTWVGGGRGGIVRGVVIPPPGKEIRVGLRAGHDVAGRVVDPSKRPVAGVRLVAFAEAYRDATTTDADGRFKLNAPGGPVLVEVDDPRWEPAKAPIAVPEKEAAPEVEIVARAAPPLEGWVRTRDGRPIVGAAVFDSGDAKRVRARSDGDGRFRLTVSRDRRIAVVAGGFGWRSCAVPKAGDLEILLDPADAVAGTVVDAAGKPLADARLAAVAFGPDGGLERVLGPRTAADGSFRFSWLPKPWRGATTPTRLIAVKRGSGESAIVSADAVRAAGGKIVVLGARDVVGRVTRAGGVLSVDGTPIADASVQAVWGHWDGGVTAPERDVFGLPESTAVRADADGRFRLRDVPLKLHARIRCAVDGVVLEKLLDPTDPAASFDFAFPAGLPIAGKVTAPDGGPVEGAINVRAQLLNAQGTEVDRTTRADPDGSFRFDPLPSGEYQITAWGPMYDMAGGAPVKAGETSTVVRMHKSSTPKFAFVFDGGAPPDERLEFVLQPYGGGAVVYKRTLEPGHAGDGIELTGVTFGTWTLQVSCGAWRGGIEKLEVGDGEKRTVDVHLVRTVRVAAKLLASDGSPRAAVLVVACQIAPTKGRVVQATSGADGSLELTGLLPGRWRASADAPGVASLRTEFDVVDGVNPPIELRMPAYGTIVVRVSGDDAPDADVTLSDAAGAPVYGWAEGAAIAMNKFHVGPDGHAAIRGVAVGTVRVEVADASSKRSLRTLDVVVAAGRDAYVDVK